MKYSKNLFIAVVFTAFLPLAFAQVRDLTEKEIAPCLATVSQDMKTTIEWRKEQMPLFSPNGQYGTRPSAASTLEYHRKEIEKLTQTTPLQYVNARFGNGGYFMKDTESIQTVRQELKDADEMAAMLREKNEEKMYRVIGAVPTGLQLDSRLAGAEAKRCLLNVRLARLTGKPMTFQPAVLPNRTMQDPAANYAFAEKGCSQEINNLRIKEPNLSYGTYIQGRMAWDDAKTKVEILRIKTDVTKREVDADRGYFMLCVLSARTALYQQPDLQVADYLKAWQSAQRPSLEASVGVALPFKNELPRETPAAPLSANRDVAQNSASPSGQSSDAICTKDAMDLQVASQSWAGNANDVAARLGAMQRELFQGRCSRHPEASAYIAGANRMIGYGGNPAGASGALPVSSRGSSLAAGSTSDASRIHKVHNPAADAKACVKMVQTSASTQSRISGNFHFQNQCDSAVTVFWCYPKPGGKCSSGGLWNISAGRGWPVMDNEASIRWGACRGRDGGGFDRDSEGGRYTCPLLQW